MVVAFVGSFKSPDLSLFLSWHAKHLALTNCYEILLCINILLDHWSELLVVYMLQLQPVPRSKKGRTQGISQAMLW